MNNQEGKPFRLLSGFLPRIRPPASSPLVRDKELGLCTSEDDGELYDVEEALERVAEHKDDNNHNQDPGNVQISPLPSEK